MADAPKRKRVRPVVPFHGEIDARGGPDSASNAGRARSKPVVLLLVFIVLAVMGWFLIQNLAATSKLQDCMMSGRKNCAPIDTSTVK